MKTLWRKSRTETTETEPARTYNGCMIYRCDHVWTFIWDPGDYVGHECARRDAHWDYDYCAHKPSVEGCRCAR